MNNILFKFQPMKDFKWCSKVGYKQYNEEFCYLPKNLSKEDAIEKLIRQKYSINDELAILRQKDSKPEEYAEYYAYAEECKIKAKEFIVIKENWNE